jgi:aspartate-semialdehyde dehydrogenase
MKKYSLAIVGATGLVGRTMLRVIEERQLPFSSLTLLASARSAGKEISYRSREHGTQRLTVQELTEDSFTGIDIALFSAGSSVSKKYAPIAAKSGCIVIDNSSAWRQHPDAPLVVPEVNADVLNHHKGIIANPNCSTIQLVVPLKILDDTFGLKRVVVSTYQAISGAGQAGIDQLYSELFATDEKELKKPSQFAHPIAFNTMFHSFGETNGVTDADTEEEAKMLRETRRILRKNTLPLSMTCVRIPTAKGHGESVNIETFTEISADKVRELFHGSNDVTLLDAPEKDQFPTPLISDDKDDIYVGRIRTDNSVPHGINMWIVSDNVRKGAATNAVQIVEKILEHDLRDFEVGNF